MAFNDGLTNGNLIIEVDEEPEAIVVRWTGKANARRPATLLRPFFDELARAATEANKRIVFDMAALEHVSSSTIVVVVQLIKQLEPSGLQLTIEYDGAVGWQHMTFSALAYLSGPALELRARAA